MRVAFSTYPWAFDCPGGGERQLHAYRTELQSKSIDTALYDLWSPRFSDFDIFHFFSAMPGSLQILDYVKKKRKKICVSPNLWITADTAYQYPVEDVGNVLSLADKIIVNSHAEIVGFKEVYGLPDDRFAVVYNGYDSVYNQSRGDGGKIFREKFGISGDYMLNIANVEPRKNQLNFLKQLKRSDVQRQLVIVGNLRDSSYADQCFEIGGELVKFVGPLEYASPEMVSAISGAAIFAMPSTVETPSIAALEAFAMGVPLLITERGCTKEYFGDYAIYVNPDDLSDIAERLADLDSVPETPIEVRSRFTWGSVVDDLIDVYNTVGA